MTEIGNTDWVSFKEYLQMDSAIAFPTESDPSGEIRPYTRARAMPNGWVWEIPTQDRRGNGYVYSSQHCTDDQAVKEVSDLLGREVEPARSFKFDPGHLRKIWVKNCVAVGLAAAFVEPIEATSIGSTIQQARYLMHSLSVYDKNSKKLEQDYNSKMNIMMENILAMISLHYISDREDSEMWRQQKMMKKPDYLVNLLELWQERPPLPYDISSMSLFEQYFAGVPVFFPTKEFYKECIKNKIAQFIVRYDMLDDILGDRTVISEQEIDKWLVNADYYNFKYVNYYTSFDDCINKLRSFSDTEKDARLAHIQTVKDDVVSKWKDIFDKIFK
jgi:hypothetical protein